MDDRKEEARKRFFNGETIAAIAETIGVTRRTIERWAGEGAWREKRGNVVSIKKQPKPDIPRPKRQRGAIDEMELIEMALGDVSSAMSTASSEDLRALGGLATALCRLIELRRKVQPPTVAVLAEQAIDLNISPSEFMAELSKQWKLRA